MLTDREQLPQDSAIGQALRDLPSSSKIYETGSVARFWFPGMAQGSKFDFVVKEQARRIGESGVLMLLTPSNDGESAKLETMLKENLGI